MALVITRKNEEQVTLTTESGTEIKITVYDAHMGACRLAIHAPRSVTVARDNAKKGARDAIQVPKSA